MEPHKDLSGIEAFRPDPFLGASAYFEKAWSFANKFYAGEMRAISSTRFEEVEPDFFFREYVWVVHATGFSAKAVGRFMGRLLEAYGPWKSLAQEPLDQVMGRIRSVCNNPQKADAVRKTAFIMWRDLEQGGVPWGEFKRARLASPSMLQRLPYVGPVTCFHLARNIGLLESVKPDLHLQRLADLWGFKTCEEMCKAVRPEGVPLGLVDLALWYAASTFGTIDVRAEGQR